MKIAPSIAARILHGVVLVTAPDEIRTEGNPNTIAVMDTITHALVLAVKGEGIDIVDAIATILRKTKERHPKHPKQG